MWSIFFGHPKTNIMVKRCLSFINCFDSTLAPLTHLQNHIFAFQLAWKGRCECNIKARQKSIFLKMGIKICQIISEDPLHTNMSHYKSFDVRNWFYLISSKKMLLRHTVGRSAHLSGQHTAAVQTAAVSSPQHSPVHARRLPAQLHSSLYSRVKLLLDC